MSVVEQQPRRLLRLPEVRQRVGLSRSEIYRRIRQKTFPRPVSLGPQTSAWDSSAVDAWISSRIEANGPESAA